MRVRDWAVALSVAAVLGLLLGAVYSGVTGWTGPSGRALPTAAAGDQAAGLPAPAERASSPAAKPAPVGTSAAPAKVEPRKVKAEPRKAKAKAEKRARASRHEDDDRSGGDGDDDKGDD
jgi:hypothetical protein